MSNDFELLAKYYFKNLVLSRIFGRMSGLILGRTEKQWSTIYEEIKGHDAWLVVGNGPSLQVEDLEAFSRLGIPAIASNKINILFNRTGWRPTLFTIADPLLLHKLPAEHYNDVGLTLLPHTVAPMARTHKKLPWRHLSDSEGEKKYLGRQEKLSPLKGFFVGGTITNPNLQLAIWAGAKTIYVIGCDHFYAHETSKTASIKSAHHGASNHFDPNYRKPGEIVNEAPVERMNRGYALIRKIADQRGVRIINVSRKTALEAFERDTVQNVLAEINEASAQTVRK